MLNYIKKSYEDLALNINNFMKEVSESLKNLSFPLNEMKDEINKVLFQFKDIIKNLSIPLILEQKGLISKKSTNRTNKYLRKLDINVRIEECRNQTENFNLVCNEFFRYLNKESLIIENEIKGIQNLTLDFHNRVEDDISNNKYKLAQFSELDDNKNMHIKLLDIKSSFISTKSYFNDQKNFCREHINYLEIEFRELDLEQLQKKSDEMIENLTKISRSIIEETNILNENKTNITIPDLNASSIIEEHIKESLGYTIQKIRIEEIETTERMEAFISEINVEEKTSLDLLFVMDLTGSMNRFFEEAKENVINIINRIIEECPGIDINFGFIGYKDIPQTTQEDYINIDFTKEYQKLQNTIKDIKTGGGKGDDPEDVAWAMEMALYKSWKNNARFLIFIADAPCHGWKYHNITTDIYPDGGENRRNIEVLIKELAEKNISLFCIKLRTTTDIMFNIFSDIYKDYNDFEFKIVSMTNKQSMSNIIINSAIEVYASQRNADI